MNTIVRRGVDQQRAPSASYVEEPLAALETQLSADEVELCCLRILERIGG